MDFEEDPAKEAGRLLQSLRKTKSGGRHGGRPATIPHEGGQGCRCVDCRKAKGWSPYGKKGEPAGGLAAARPPAGRVAPKTAEGREGEIDADFDFGA